MATEVPIHFLQSVKPPPTTTIPVEDIPDEDKGTTNVLSSNIGYN
jgi:hypothetical protein